MATRGRLHGLKWPSTNSKFLAVEYLTPADVSRISEGQLEVKEVIEGEEGTETAAAGNDVMETVTTETTKDGAQSCMIYLLAFN